MISIKLICYDYRSFNGEHYELVYDSPVVPRKGELVDLGDRIFIVKDVFHKVDMEKAAPGRDAVSVTLSVEETN